MVNSTVAVFPTTCGPCFIAQAPLYNLGMASPSDCVFDPQVEWDQQWGRWIYAMSVQHSSAVGGCTGDKNVTITSEKLVIGWTYSSDANDFLKANVCINPIDTGSYLHDFPRLGHDDRSLLVGANVFSNYGAGSFVNSVVWIKAKPDNVSAANPCGIGGGATQQFSLGTTVFTPVPAIMTDSSPVGYVVAAQDPRGGTANNLFVWQTSVSPGIPYTSMSFTFVGYFGVAAYGVPPDVPQPSTGTASCTTAGNCLDAGDARLTQAIGHYDPDTGYEAIWTQHAIADPRFPARSVGRWYELVPATGAVRQSGFVSDPSLHIFNGAVSPTAAGNEAVIFYNAGDSGANGFASYRSQSRNGLSPLGYMSNEVVLAPGTVNNSDFSCGASRTPPAGFPCRWGDYSAARPDPTNVNAVWGIGMLTGSAGTGTIARWTTQVSEVTPGCSAVQLFATSLGGGVQFTAGVQGPGPGYVIGPAAGCSNPRYQFWLQAPGGAWTIVQPFSSSSVWTWNTNGYRPGTYNVDVWANQYGDSPASAESFAVTQWTIPYCTFANLTPNMMSPQPSGTRITLTASSTCPNPNPKYQFWMLPPGGPWTVVQSYSTNTAINWDTTGKAPGLYHFSVWVVDAQSSGAFGTPPNTYDAYGANDMTLTTAYCTGMTGAQSPPSTATVGTVVAVTGAATGCPSPQYQFWLLPPGGTWTLLQPYSSGATFTWNTAGRSAGTYRFSVWARDASSSAAYDVFNAFDYPLTTTACIGMSAIASPATSASVGTTVTITGSATGCPNKLYQLWLLPPGGAWAVAQPYSNNATFSWNTSGKAAGSYRFSVWARDMSSSAAYDAFSAFDYSLMTTPCTGMTATASPATSAPVGTTVTITGGATGCPNPLYQFWLLPPGGTWSVVQPYSSSATLTWTTTGKAAGSYRFSVWARDWSSAGASGTAPNTYDAFGAFNYTLS